MIYIKTFSHYASRSLDTVINEWLRRAKEICGESFKIIKFQVACDSNSDGYTGMTNIAFLYEATTEIHESRNGLMLLWDGCQVDLKTMVDGETGKKFVFEYDE